MSNVYDLIYRHTEELARAAIVPKPGFDYQENGLWYCGNCHTPMEYVMPPETIYAGEIVRCNCHCRSEALAADRKEQERKRRVPELLERCFGGRADDAIREQTFDNDKGYAPELMARARQYYHMVTDGNAPENLRHKGLLICGSIGCGKSYAACAILNALMREQLWSCQMLKLKTVVNTLWNSQDREGYIEHLTSARFLYIDDLREEYLKEGKSELVYDLLERRQESGKPVIVTTNIPLQVFSRQDLPNDLQRIYSRLLGMCIPVEVVSGDIRRRQAADDMKAYRTYLDGVGG